MPAVITSAPSAWASRWRASPSKSTQASAHAARRSGVVGWREAIASTSAASAANSFTRASQAWSAALARIFGPHLLDEQLAVRVAEREAADDPRAQEDEQEEVAAVGVDERPHLRSPRFGGDLLDDR